MMCRDVLCQQFKILSHFVFNHLKIDRIISHQTLEETITDILNRQFKILSFTNSFSRFSIRHFTKLQESKNGADYEWDWYFVDSMGKKWLGFRIQAKMLNLKTDRFSSLYHTNNNGSQISLLNKSSCKDNRIPFYCFYLHKSGESSLRGCSLAFLKDVQLLLNNNKRPHVDDVLKYSFPWHELFCFIKCDMSNLSLPEKVRDFLKLENIEVSFLTLEEINNLEAIINNTKEDVYKTITIFRDMDSSSFE